MTEEILQKAISVKTEIDNHESDKKQYSKMLHLLLENGNKNAILTIQEARDKARLEVTVTKSYAERILRELHEECDDMIARKKLEIQEL